MKEHDFVEESLVSEEEEGMVGIYPLLQVLLLH